MTEVNGRESSEIQGHDVLDTIRALIRLAPILAVVLALSACGKKADDPELQACRIETARIEGILQGVGIDSNQSPTDTIQACLVAKARIEGIMRGAAMRDKEVKVQLDAMGVKLGFDLPGGKAHPGLGEEGDTEEKNPGGGYGPPPSWAPSHSGFGPNPNSGGFGPPSTAPAPGKTFPAPTNAAAEAKAAAEALAEAKARAEAEAKAPPDYDVYD